jgi:hypothetical protein
VRKRKIDNTAAGGIPQKGDVFIPCRCGSYPVGCFIIRFAPVGSHFYKESGEAQSDLVVQELQHPSDDIKPKAKGFIKPVLRL